MIDEVEDVLIGALLKTRNSGIVSMPSNLPVTETAKLMTNHQIGSVVIKDDKIIGIITKGDIIQQVVGRGLDPGIVLAGDVMSKPVTYVLADETLENTMLLMSKRQIERILVVDENDPTIPLGIVSTNDLLRFAPGLLSIRREQQLVTTISSSSLETSYFQGFCDDCNNYSEKLSLANGYTLCPRCISLTPGEFNSNDDEIL
ncbi:MAG: CBS domain-containing protein [Candidatus Hodarchaeales archaeon]|jgi:CBS domain-containing protein